MSYWGFFGGVNVPLPEWGYTVFNGIAAVSVTGLVVAVANMRRGNAPRTTPLLLARASTALWILVLFLSLIRWTQSTWASQGRLMFAAIAPISAWMAFGLYRLWPARSRVLAIVAAWFIVVAACAPILIHQAYTEADFPISIGSYIKLKLLRTTFTDDTDSLNKIEITHSYNIPQTINLGDYLIVDVIFSVPRWMPSSTEWSAFVHLINMQGVIVAQRDVLLRQGLWSTKIMQTGSKSLFWRNRFAIQIPDHAYAPDTLRIMLGFYDSATGRRMNATPITEPGDIQDNAVTLGTVNLLPPASTASVPNPTSINFGNQIEFIGYDISDQNVTPDQEVTVTLFWRANAKPTVDLSAFVQVFRFGTSEVYGGSDGISKPTSQWQPGGNHH